MKSMSAISPSHGQPLAHRLNEVKSKSKHYAARSPAVRLPSNVNKKKRMPRPRPNNTLNTNVCAISESPNANANVIKLHIYQQKWPITAAPSTLTAWSDLCANLAFCANSSY